ncbi:ABC transporter permease [Clostridium autoethanogenum]|uniref:ABC transporter permease n=2 Tax=Clostridium autoethanogenum TaxID=84023 RepID=A0A3M0SX13_9CLOT|nr:ABC transporter permease [Clostridium autoethanogenum]AGY76951.1 ABC transporter permease [Clostridium autoethanogenum DSM 10061]ALU37094.1 ABC-type transporter [Clostridium autoethanogenum DSM 10061]OVY48548.1 ABC-2 family transporter protein [Clostridium autoethanogenum]RMC99197.1 ABC transporter permease [Clostridium autoethanogenum]
MFNIVYSEFLKLKKSYLVIITLIAAIFVPILECIQALSNNYRGSSETLRNTLFMNYRVNIEVICFQFLYIVFFSLIASYVFSREFTDKTANTLFIYPSSRIKIFIGKLITVYIIIAFAYFIQSISTYLTLYISWRNLLPSYLIVKDIEVNLYSMLFQFLLIPIPILIGNLTKNIIFPVIYGILGAVSSAFMMLMGIYMQVDPLMLPALPIYYFYKGDPIDYVLVISSAVLTFGVSIFLCLYHYINGDIN